MKLALEMSFRGVTETEDIKNLVRKRVAKLDQVCNYMISCRVAIEVPHQHQRSGRGLRIRIEITVPHRHDLVIKRESGKGDMHEPLSAVLRRAFDAARRELQELVDRQHREVKVHVERRSTGVVVELLREEGYGFLETVDGREVYFHRNSVQHDNFRRLEVGTRVSFVEHQGEKGPQASAVEILKKL